MKKADQEAVRSRGQGRCEYCHIPGDAEAFGLTIDHIIASQHLQDNSPSNLALCCWHCNLKKGPNLAGIDPQTQAITRLFHPRRDKWEEHFVQLGPTVQGLSAVGRTTVACLAINDDARVLLRTYV